MDSVTKDRTLKAADKLARQGKFDAAIEEYRKVSKGDPDDLTVANTLGDLYVRQGRTPEAIKHFTRIADRFNTGGFQEKAIAMYKKIAKLDPNNFDLLIQLAELYSHQGRYADAKQQYGLVSDAYRRNGDVREALKILKKATDLDPSNVRSRIGLAKAYEKDGFTSEASDAYRAAGQELVRAEKIADAIEAFTKALELKPESRGALKSLAEAHASQGNVKPALDVVARALENDPNDVDLIIILGRTFLNAGMLEKAEATFNRLFKLDNSRYDYLLEVGRAYIAQGEHNRALAVVDRCIEVLLARRQKKKATALLKAILERDPQNILVLKRLASIYKGVRERRNLVNTLNTLVQAALAQDMRAEAVVALRQLIEIEPKKAVYQEQLRSLHDEDEVTTANVAQKETEYVREDYDSYGDYSTELLEEMVARHPEFLAARLKLLEDLVAQQPAYMEGRIKLKQLYLDGGQADKAAAQCVEIARYYEQHEDEELAAQYRAEAAVLNPTLARKPDATKAARAPEPAPTAAGPAVKLSEMLGVEEFEKLFEQEWRRAAREPKPITLLKIAVDRFKAYEAKEGAARSLRGLERVAGALEAELKRSGQLLASGGNEEFYVLLPETHPGTAGSIADAMRKAVEALGIPHPDGSSLTVSLGIATAFPYRMTDSDAITESIHKALATAQSRGGNRVVTVPLLGG